MNTLQNEEDIFLAALEIDASAKRTDYVNEACGGNADLRRRVDALLARHHESQGMLDAPPPGIDATVENPITEQPGTVIGPYKLLQQIGEGGMGVVFMAEQTQPVQRTVALKIIKPGMDTRKVIARFEAERQALALMDHPNIARVLDAGTTGGEGVRFQVSGVSEEQRALHPTPDTRHLTPPTGRPYFVMDLVKGVPITDYCDGEHLTIRERLELMVQVCSAVQHAHQKGIIHRDLKPSNVLVAEYDGRPVPKIIDFGVAKATAQRLTERTMFTEYGQLIGTFEYMSPEQARFNQLDVDTRSDIYSLGVLLYALLTGLTPFDKQRIETAPFDETLRMIREEEPPKPSTRLGSSGSLPSAGRAGEGGNSATIAANRGVEPGKLISVVRGELDWIVMKCLEKDRSRRYESASSLAHDIERYLNDEPVQACPPSASYRFRKFARRNKALLASMGTIATALAFGLALSTWMYFRAAAERDRAEAISGFLQWVLASSDNADVEAVVRSGIDINVQHDQEFAEPAEEAKFAISHAWLGNYLATTGKQQEANAVIRKAADHFGIAAKRGLPPAVQLQGFWYLAIAQLRAENAPGYREACRALFQVPTDNDDDRLLQLSIWCLGPHPGADFGAQLKQAEEMAMRHAANNYVGSHSAPWIDLGLLGGLLYRSEQYEQAAQRLEESLAAYPNDALGEFRTALDRKLLLAMAKWQLGKRNEARRLLAEAQPAIDEWLQLPSNTWMRRAEVELFRREAEGLIEPKKANEAVENKRQINDE